MRCASWRTSSDPSTARRRRRACRRGRVCPCVFSGRDTLAPADRALTIYPRYTAAEAAPGPGGLTVVAFRDGTPYQGEDLIYDDPAPTFFVRCTRNRAGPVPGICLYERRLIASLRRPR